MQNSTFLPSTFFSGDAPHVARALLGCVLFHDTVWGRLAGRIVETEAYDETDAASHSCHGRTARNQVMFGPGGVAYVYRSYGIHWCMNVSAGPEDYGAAVLLRAIEPLAGHEIMSRLRGLNENSVNVASGPGRLTQAMAIDLSHNGAILQGPLGLVYGTESIDPAAIIATPRIGISKAVDVPWRFCIAGHPAVSGPKRLSAARP